ncbi:hypothetical protein NTHI1209_00713 [Haemophilus influenzae]|nr:hypothetical protein NTHI1209_00713 [Haemophilus influenzae]
MQVEGKANVYKIITGILANQVLIKSLNNIPMLLLFIMGIFGKMRNLAF